MSLAAAKRRGAPSSLKFLSLKTKGSSKGFGFTRRFQKENDRSRVSPPVSVQQRQR